MFEKVIRLIFLFIFTKLFLKKSNVSLYKISFIFVDIFFVFASRNYMFFVFVICLNDEQFKQIKQSKIIYKFENFKSIYRVFAK